MIDEIELEMLKREHEELKKKHEALRERDRKNTIRLRQLGALHDPTPEDDKQFELNEYKVKHRMNAATRKAIFDEYIEKRNYNQRREFIVAQAKKWDVSEDVIRRIVDDPHRLKKRVDELRMKSTGIAQASILEAVPDIVDKMIETAKTPIAEMPPGTAFMVGNAQNKIIDLAGVKIVNEEEKNETVIRIETGGIKLGQPEEDS